MSDREKCRCPNCGALHVARRNKGSQEQSKESLDRDVQVLNAYLRGGRTYSGLAQEFGLSASRIGGIIKRALKRFPAVTLPPITRTVRGKAVLASRPTEESLAALRARKEAYSLRHFGRRDPLGRGTLAVTE